MMCALWMRGFADKHALDFQVYELQYYLIKKQKSLRFTAQRFLYVSFSALDHFREG